jgi:tRNA A-37 threonylcarbamoyl transferase component Bud32
MPASRQLLLALLAVQRGLVDPARVVEARDDPTDANDTSLADRLVQRGWLSPQQRQELEAEVRRRLDAEKDTAEPGPQASDTDAGKALAFLARPMDEPTGEPGRYSRTKLHATGGMGRVWQARDDCVGRQVALKELKPEREDDPELRARFLAEARITGQLEHPGIVPVYEVVERDGEAPFYTMRLVSGRTLSEAVAEFHGRWGGPDEVALRDLLGAFVSVCNTLAYAHSRGVVHRDLKPLNVVLGPFGEVVVLDWGLAKVLGAGAEEPAVRPLPGGEPEATQEGQLVGTLGYMAPEQARGEVGRIDARTDVFGLGAVLYEVLTGRPPYVAKDTLELLLLAGEARVKPPRRLAGWIPAPLEAVCLKALQARPEDRYQSAAELGDEVKRWLADEPVTAHHESVVLRMRRRARKHPKTMAALAATVLLGLLGAGAGAAVLGWKNRQLEEAREEAVTRLGQVEKGNEILGSIFADLDPRAEEKEGRPLREILGARLDKAAAALDAEAIGDSLMVASMQDRLGQSYLGLSYPGKAMALLGKAVETRTARLGEDHPDTLTSRNNLAGAYRDAGKWELAIPLYERTLKAREASQGEDHPDTLTSRNDLGLAYTYAGKLDLAVPLLERTLKAREASLGEDHPDTLRTRNNLAMAYTEAGRFDLIITLFERTVKAFESKLGADHVETLKTRNNLAEAYRAVGKLDLAIPLLVRTVKAFESKLGENDLLTLTCRANLALAYLTGDKPELAIPLFERTLKALESKLGDAHPSTLQTRHNLATSYKAADRLYQAIPLFERTLKLRESKLGGDHPDTLRTRNNLAHSYQMAGNLELAIPLYERTLKDREAKLGKDHPHTLISLDNLAMAYREAGKAELAISLHGRALKGFEAKLGADHPSTLTCRDLLARAYQAAGKPESAIPLFERTLKDREAKLGADNPSTLSSRNSLAAAYSENRQYVKAIVLLSEAVAGVRKQGKPGDLRFADTLALLGDAMLKANRPADAEPALRESLTLHEKFEPNDWRKFRTISLLGEALVGQKKHKDAEELLPAGYQGLKERQDKIPPIVRRRHLEEALQRLVRLGEATGDKEATAKWQKELAAFTVQEKKPKP